MLLCTATFCCFLALRCDRRMLIKLVDGGLQGDEAAECCRILSFAIVKFIQGAAMESKQELKEQVLGSLHEYGPTMYSGECLAKGVAEQEHDENSELDLKDRKWTWKSEEHKYCRSRARAQPGYIGSYSMDGLCMALHCVWTTASFEAAVLKAANMRGDADTVAAITGQLAGALYGVTAIPAGWLAEVNRWDNGTIALRARWLFQRAPPGNDVADDPCKPAAAAAAAGVEAAAAVAASVSAAAPTTPALGVESLD
eukprot:m.46199 g.46199  ORF g.46199 m.46199 type:complete len:255 (+) comp11838_c0_seq1:198-962(+)